MISDDTIFEQKSEDGIVKRIAALVASILIVAAVLAFMVQRIGAVIGWDRARNSWPVIVVLVAVVLLIGRFAYLAVRNKISR